MGNRGHAREGTQGDKLQDAMGPNMDEPSMIEWSDLGCPDAEVRALEPAPFRDRVNDRASTNLSSVDDRADGRSRR